MWMFIWSALPDSSKVSYEAKMGRWEDEYSYVETSLEACLWEEEMMNTGERLAGWIYPSWD